MSHDYDKDLFVNLSKYKPTQDKTPLENFATEAFVYILKDLLLSNEKCAKEILGLFGIKADINKQAISTQKDYSVDNQKLRPDIEIVCPDKVIFIEVKVESALRDSVLGLNDQLYDYEQIQIDNKETEVYCLSKYFVSSKKSRNIRWYQIAEILKKYNDGNQLMQNFLYFLNFNRMGELKTLSMNDSVNLISKNQAFIDYLKAIYETSSFSGNAKYQLGSVYSKFDGIGFYIQDSTKLKSTCEENSYYFLGLLPENEDKINFLVLCGCLKDEYSKQWQTDWIHVRNHPIVSKKDINEIEQSSDIDSQIQIGVEWLNSVYGKLGDFVNPDYI